MKRRVGPFEVQAIGLGCMGFSHGYGTPPTDAESEQLIHRAIDMGHDFLDTASLYGAGKNETMVGRALKGRRGEVVLASKCGIVIEGTKRYIDCSPAGVRKVLDESLQRLGVDMIDLYYLHRRDFNVPIEESVGALVEAKQAGKIRAIGLSEMSAETLRRAASVHPIAAMQTEYSPWTRNAELGVLDACQELGTAFVAFSPVARGFLADAIHDADALPEGDLRRAMPRFQGENFAANLKLLDGFRAIAAGAGMTPAQLSLGWVLAKGDHIVAIPGTTKLSHLEENWGAMAVVLSPETIAAVDALINQGTVHGHRYPTAVRGQIDTEEFETAAAN